MKNSGIDTDELIMTNLFTKEEFKEGLLFMVNQEIERQLERLTEDYKNSDMNVAKLSHLIEQTEKERTRMIEEVELLLDSYDFKQLRRGE